MCNHLFAQRPPRKSRNTNAPSTGLQALKQMRSKSIGSKATPPPRTASASAAQSAGSGAASSSKPAGSSWYHLQPQHHSDEVVHEDVVDEDQAQVHEEAQAHVQKLVGTVRAQLEKDMTKQVDEREITDVSEDVLTGVSVAHQPLHILNQHSTAAKRPRPPLMGASEFHCRTSGLMRWATSWHLVFRTPLARLSGGHATETGLSKQ